MGGQPTLCLYLSAACSSHAAPLDGINDQLPGKVCCCFVISRWVKVACGRSANYRRSPLDCSKDIPGLMLMLFLLRQGLETGQQRCIMKLLLLLPMMPGLVMMSTSPPAATLTTASPEAIASRATKPSVSDSLGIMKMSALAYAADSSSPPSIPYTAAVLPGIGVSAIACLEKWSTLNATLLLLPFSARSLLLNLRLQCGTHLHHTEFTLASYQLSDTENPI